MSEAEKPIKQNTPSAFKTLEGIEYFEFEEDFVEANVRCIPMIVRFKLDLAGIKLQLGEWVKFNVNEKIALATMNCGTEGEIRLYKDQLVKLIGQYAGTKPTVLEIDQHPGWTDKTKVPAELAREAKKFGGEVSVALWKSLTDLQRFALVKLVKPGHENKNFPKALKEFGLLNKK
ncbi:MAG TPA: nitrate reductase associated protein [Agriterribacter sp.]|nr:nitrate reductase associated protein [Agriterribacter sp.]